MILPPIEFLLYGGALALVALGIAGMVLARHLFRTILALGLVEAGANLLLILAGYRAGGVAPILIPETLGRPMMDPVPQALVLTAIVIGVGVQALALALALRVHRAYGTLEVAEVRRRMDADIDAAAGLAPEVSKDLPHLEGTR